MRKEPMHYYQNRFTFALCLFMACVFLHAQFSPAHAKTPDGKDILQFTSGGHILGFSPDSMYLASGSHMLKAEFAGKAKSVTPVSKEGPSRDGKPQLFNKVTYQNVWDGVDIVYEKSKGSLVKSTYTVSPGKEAKSIRLRYNRPLSLDKNGNLVVRYETGTMTESKPVAWQVIEGKKKAVMVAYNLITEKEVGFTVSDYDRELPLVIDPLLTWTSFLGAPLDPDAGAGSEQAYGIAADASGNTYVVGDSQITWGSPVRAFQFNGGQTDAFVAKLDTDGNLVWNTFLGSPQIEHGYGIAVDLNGNVYASGTGNYTWGSPVRAYAGDNYSGYDAFVAKLDTDGNLLWNTFLGTSGSADAGWGIGADSSGTTVYVTGSSTASWGSPVRPLTSAGGGSDAFVAKLNTADGTLLWNTFLGGTGYDSGYGLLVDGSGNAFISGQSSATWGSPVSAYNAGYDAFVAKLDTSGNLLWNTFLGGAKNDFGYGIALDDSGSVYSVGMSLSTWGAPIRAYTSDYDVFVAKLDTSGSLLWNTFLGGTGQDNARAIQVDATGIYVGGYNTPWTAPLCLRPYSGSYDAWVAGLDTSGNLIWNAFLGSNNSDVGLGMAMDGSGNLYVAGSSGDTWGDPVIGFHGPVGTGDAFVAKLTVPYHTLSTSKTGTGAGSLTSSRSGVNCGSTCSASFVEGESVTLTATPATGSTFSGWSGGCSGTGACAVVMSDDVSVAAGFTLNTYTVGASVLGGHGAVSPDSQLTGYGHSASITLTADSGYRVGTLSDNSQEVTGAKARTAGGKTLRSGVAPSAKAAIPNPYIINNVTGAHAVVVTYEVDSPCTYTLSSTEKDFTSRGGSFNITIKATGAATCAEPAVVARDAWIGAQLTSFKNNRGTIKITAPANDTAAAKSGKVAIQGNNFVARQAGASCTLAISSTKAALDPPGGTGSFTVTATPGCSWTAAVDSGAASWLSTSSTGTGSGSVSYTASANDTAKQLNGKITVSIQGNSSIKKTFTVTEAVCSIASISPPNHTFESAGGTESFTVTASAGCAWSVSPSEDWIGIESIDVTGKGTGAVTYLAIGNTTGKQRSGKITVSLDAVPKTNKAFTVTEKK